MPYIGIFTEDKLQKQIEEAAKKLDTANGLVLHADTDGDVHLSLIQKGPWGVSVEGTIALDVSHGFIFDKEHLAGKIDIIKKWD